jgi:periplasmic divalent cation tolerance protein
MTEVCAVTITAPDAEWLTAFVRRMVEDRLCAGGHITTPIRSVYRWQGQVHDVPEAHVVLHTRAALLPEIIRRTQAEHPYEVPCVVSSPITGGSPDYMEWIVTQTRST